MQFDAVERLLKNVACPALPADVRGPWIISLNAEN